MDTSAARLPWAHIVTALAGGSALHRLMSGDGPEGPWCGAGVDWLVLGATLARVATGEGASALDGRHTVADSDDAGAASRTLEIDIPIEADLGAAFEQARARLQTLDPSLAARSAVVAMVGGGRPVAAWFGVGPPACSVVVRCWPGIVHGPDASGDKNAPAPLSDATEVVAAALRAGRVSSADVASALAPARAEALAEGLLAERHAVLMDAAGDDRGAAVRRVVAQAYAVDLALRSLRDLGRSVE